VHFLIKIVQKKLYKNKLYKNKLYNNIILIKVAMISIKKAHREAKKSQPFIVRDIGCKRKLEYPTGSIHLIPLGKGFQKVQLYDTFSSLQNKRKNYENMINQAKK